MTLDPEVLMRPNGPWHSVVAPTKRSMAVDRTADDRALRYGSPPPSWPIGAVIDVAASSGAVLTMLPPFIGAVINDAAPIGAVINDAASVGAVIDAAASTGAVIDAVLTMFC